jgi:hypothetical protein
MAQLTRIVPSSVIPGLVAPIFQKVPFRKYLAEVTRFGARGVDILYQTRVSRINTPTTIGQQWRGDVDAVGFSLSQLGFPYYTIMARQEYTPNDESKFELTIPGVGLKQFQADLCEQGIYQRLHYATLYGFDSDQGIAKNGTNTSMPNDSGGHSTVQTYVIAELVAYLASIARGIMNTTYGMAKPAVVTAPLNMINYIQSILVPLTTYQMPGAGTDSIGGTLGRVIGEWLGIGKIDWIPNNALAGKGTAGKDLILFIAPGLSEQEAGQPENTNLVADNLKQNYRNTFMDMVDGLKEFPNPMMNGIASSIYSVQTTPGALIRPETLVAVSYTF